MGTQEVKVMVAIEAAKPPESIKSCPLTQGSYRLKSITPLASRGDASSNLHHSMSRDELSLPMVPEREKFPHVKDLKSVKKREDSSVNQAASEDRLRNATDVTLPRAIVRIENSLAETDRTDQDFSAKKQRLDPVLLNGIAQSSDGSDNRGVNTNPSLGESETDIVETKNLKFESDPCGTQSLYKRVKHHERKEKRKYSSKKVDKRLRKENVKEMLRPLANDLIRENSKLTEKLLLFSEKCQEINEENNSLMDELEKEYGLDAISDLRAKNPATANRGSNSEGERAEGSDDSTVDQKKDAPKVEFY